MKADDKMDWAKLLAEAITEPGKIRDAYRRFNGYSLGNRFRAFIQCTSRGITPGPLATFNRRKDLGRTVQKGQKVIPLLHACYVQTQADRRSRKRDRGQLSVLRHQEQLVRARSNRRPRLHAGTNTRVERNASARSSEHHQSTVCIHERECARLCGPGPPN